MSDSTMKPASEVVRNAESDVLRARDLRVRAAELIAQAVRLEDAARTDAIAALGETAGLQAFSLACMVAGVEVPSPAVPVAPPVLSVSPAAPVSVAPARPEPSTAAQEEHVRLVFKAPPEETQVEEKPPVAAPSRAVAVPPPAAPVAAAVPQRAEARVQPPVEEDDADEHPASRGPADPSRLVLYGVEVKRSKSAEAEEVVEQARNTASQNKKFNPYAGDRGRNSWRNALFAAALAHHSQDGAAPAAAELRAPAAQTPVVVEEAVAAETPTDIEVPEVSAAPEETGRQETASDASTDEDAPVDFWPSSEADAAEDAEPDTDAAEDVDSDLDADQATGEPALAAAEEPDMGYAERAASAADYSEEVDATFSRIEEPAETAPVPPPEPAPAPKAPPAAAPSFARPSVPAFAPPAQAPQRPSVAVSRPAPAADILDDPLEDRVPPRTAPPPSRAVPFTVNPVQIAPVAAAPPAPAPAKAPAPKATPPFAAAKPQPTFAPSAAKPKEEEAPRVVGVSYPVTNRRPAFGQASPVPDGLRDIPRAETSTPSAPVTPVRPPNTRPSFLK